MVIQRRIKFEQSCEFENELCVSHSNEFLNRSERRVAQLLGGFMQGSQVPEISWFPLKEFVPQIRSAAQTVMGLVRLNSCVHVQTYNQIIAKAVSELD
jgi:hypothetical protein